MVPFGSIIEDVLSMPPLWIQNDTKHQHSLITIYPAQEAATAPLRYFSVSQNDWILAKVLICNVKMRKLAPFERPGMEVVRGWPLALLLEMRHALSFSLCRVPT